jgi:hypothetical protein
MLIRAAPLLQDRRVLVTPKKGIKRPRSGQKEVVVPPDSTYKRLQDWLAPVQVFCLVLCPGLLAIPLSLP